jgi:kynurenine formamidase
MGKGGKTMWVDLSWPIYDGMPVYPGDKQTRLTQEKWVEKDFYTAFTFDTGLHAGTHMDAPMHLISHASGVAEIPLFRCFAKGVLLDVRGQSQIHKPNLLKGLLAGKAVLLKTGMEAAYGTDNYYDSHPIVSMELAELLVQEEIAFLGMDMPSPDVPPFPVHKLLLAAGIPIVENMRGLDKLTGEFEVAAFPLNIHAEASPVRAAARLFHDKSDRS